ncbi:hypothetical protein [Alteribacter natronophilus]|uniref:hypothetical protein n=1 Tax=Alteribacter natronophilus TaxID=2583810 RepID=UPI00110E0B6C|nr:hypothetical protein [Alteribacter natronophilus]TMW72446.1 hypothetical protein FGB90_09630 [Alteribacter natronophilus]
MFILLFLLAVTAFSIFMMIRRKQGLWLTVPVLAMFGYVIVQIIMVPAPFGETVRFIFNLQ